MFRLEFAETRSPTFPWVLRLAKKLRTYKGSVENGVTVHSVSFTDEELGEFLAIFETVRWWKSLACYVDNRLVPVGEAMAQALMLYRRGVRAERAYQMMMSQIRQARRPPELGGTK